MTQIPAGQEPWIAAHIYFDEVGNSFNDATQQVFAFAGIAFASEQQRDRVAIAVPQDNDTFRLLNPSASDASSSLDPDKLIISVSYVDLRGPRVRDLIEHGKQSVTIDGIAHLVPGLERTSGKNWIWITAALMSLSNIVSRLVVGYGQYLAELHVVYDERRLDPLTSSIMRDVLKARFLGKAFFANLKGKVDDQICSAIDQRMNIQRLRVRGGSDDREPALRLAHRLARTAFSGLNPPDSPSHPERVERIRREHGANSVQDITQKVVD